MKSDQALDGHSPLSYLSPLSPFNNLTPHIHPANSVTPIQLNNNQTFTSQANNNFKKTTPSVFIPKKVNLKQTITNRTQILQQSRKNKTQTQRQLNQTIQLLHQNTHQRYEHQYTVDISEINNQYKQIQQKDKIQQNKTTDKSINIKPQLQIEEEINDIDSIQVILGRSENNHYKNNDIFNMMAQSIKLKSQERKKTIDINKEKFIQSPYKVKQLILRPSVIYPKDNQDQLFLMSEGNKKVKEFKSSHYKYYGDSQVHKNKQSINLKINLQVDNFQHHQSLYKNVDELKNDLKNERDKSFLSFQQSHSTEHCEETDEFNKQQKAKIIDQSKFNDQKIEEQEKSLLKSALLLKKKQRAIEGMFKDATQIQNKDQINNNLEQEISIISLLSQISKKNQTISTISYKQNDKDSSYEGRKGRNLIFKKKRYSANEIDKQNKDLQKKLKKLQEETLQRMESFNIKPPQRWVNKNRTLRESRDSQLNTDTKNTKFPYRQTTRDINDSSMSTFDQTQTRNNQISALNNRSKTPLLNYSYKIEDPYDISPSIAQIQQQLKPQTAGNGLNSQKKCTNFLSTTNVIFNNQSQTNQIYHKNQSSMNQQNLKDLSIKSPLSVNNFNTSGTQNNIKAMTSNYQNQKSALSESIYSPNGSIKLKINHNDSMNRSIYSNTQTSKYKLIENKNQSLRLVQPKLEVSEFDIVLDQQDIKPLPLPFNNFCGNCKQKNQSFVEEGNKQYAQVQRLNDGRRFLVNRDQINRGGSYL